MKEIEINRLLSKDVTDAINRHGFTIAAKQIYNGDVISGPILFVVSCDKFPKIPILWDGRRTTFEPYDFFITCPTEIRIEINMFNRAQENFDFEVIEKFAKCVDSLDVSKLTNAFTNDEGHGIHGMPFDMKERYEFVEAQVNEIRKVSEELKALLPDF